MLRHAIAPTRYFSQISNDILRHPKLNADAVRLLAWQLSLPPGARESLSRTAERAGIGKVAFMTAKRQLQAAGYVHEWRLQRERGLWVTEQLIANVPLTPEEAAVVRDAESFLVRGAGDAFAQVAPSDRFPAAGQPTVRASGGHPEVKTAGNTSTPPTPAADAVGLPGGDGEDPNDDLQVCSEDPEPEPTHQAFAEEPASDQPAATGNATAAPVESPSPAEATAASHLAQARVMVDQLPQLDRRLLVPGGMIAELTELVTQWLAAGHQPDDVQAAVRRGMPGANESVHRPGGLVRYLLRDVPPVPPAPSACPEPPVSAAPSGVPAPPLLSARLARGRECEGDHDQATLFVPEGDEDLCRQCRP